MIDAAAYIEQLVVSNPLQDPIMRSAIRALQLPTGSHGLDAGCGIGLQAVLLAEAVGTAGHVTGLDLHPEFLRHAEQVVQETGWSKQISFQQGDVRSLPFDDDTFDWAWSANCVGYAPINPVQLQKELKRVVKPRGFVIILAWSSEKLLPGYSLLEARLSGTAAGIAPFVEGYRPERHFLRALGWFREVGLRSATAQTFVGDAHAPLSQEMRDALIALFEMRWTGVERELSLEDWSAFQRLCRPESPEFILNRPDYYAFFTYSLFQGEVDK
jgi:demethylmenaquinone methyltransferase/2-methoxy-6-polyprenyl-1,4-benzoquinol methylase